MTRILTRIRIDMQTPKPSGQPSNSTVIRGLTPDGQVFVIQKVKNLLVFYNKKRYNTFKNKGGWGMG